MRSYLDDMNFVLTDARADLAKLDRALKVLELAANLKMRTEKCAIIPVFPGPTDALANSVRICRHVLSNIPIVYHTKLLGLIVGPRAEHKVWESYYRG